MLSLTMQVPLTSTASHGMMVPLLGMTITSPGTRSVDKISSISVRKGRREGCNGGVEKVNMCIKTQRGGVQCETENDECGER